MGNRFGQGSPDEVREYFDGRFSDILSPVMLAIEAEVTGTDVGATSWSSPAQVDDMIGHLDLQPGEIHLDIGSGSGWPALRIAEKTGASIVMTDLPFTGLAHGVERGRMEDLGLMGVQASGAALPFGDGSFRTITHSDVLCCLAEKDEVLAECRRLISNDGIMAFTVITLSDGAAGEDLARVGPHNELVASRSPYPEMLADARFRFEVFDLSSPFLETAERVLRARSRNYDGLVDLLGQEDADDMLNRSESNVTNIEARLLRRHMYVCRPG